MIYDITSYQNAKDTLCQLLNLTKEQLENGLQQEKGADVDSFLTKVDRSLKDFDLDSLKIVGIHSTTNNDKCASIKKTGLVNMKQALSCDSCLNQYIKANGIEIDIYKKKMTYQGKSYHLIDQGNSRLHYKIFGDYQLDCFLAIRKNRPYDNALKARPKVLKELEDYLNIPSLHQNWINQAKPYMIKFLEEPRAFNPYSFSVDGSEIGMKTALLYYALMVVQSNEQIDVQIDLASEHQVLPENILDIQVIEEG